MKEIHPTVVAVCFSSGLHFYEISRFASHLYGAPVVGIEVLLRVDEEQGRLKGTTLLARGDGVQQRRLDYGRYT